MRDFITSLLLFALVNTAGANEIVDGAKDSLDAWQPVDIFLDDSVLVVVADEERVTETIYLSMLKGVCVGILFRPNSLKGVESVQILNEFGLQGYVFEGGNEECKAVNDAPSGEAALLILAQSHLY